MPLPIRHTAFLLLGLATIAPSLSGCVMVAMSAIHYGADSSSIDASLSSAEAGNPEAQFKVGRAYCCSAPGQLNPAKSTEKATFWLCRAAAQRNGDAEYLLGRLYMGDLKGQGLLSLAAGELSDNKKSPEVAAAWLRRAADHGVLEAAKKLRALEAAPLNAPPTEADQSPDTSERLPCLWSEVFAKQTL